MRLCSARDHCSHVRWHSHRRLACTAILVGLAAALLLDGFGATSARATSVAAATWKAQDASSAGSAADLYSVAFPDAAHGWAVGYAHAMDSAPNSTPVILATSNGGATWTAQDASSAGSTAALYSVTFTDAAHGWAVGDATDSAGNDTPVILATSDGGATWAAQDASSAASGVLVSVAFADAAHGWAVGYARDSAGDTPVILATSDGGATWTAQDASSAGSPAFLLSVAFVDVTHGWAVGSEGSFGDGSPVILATSDGGATWKAQDASSAGGRASLGSVAFVDAEHGWAVGWAYGTANSSVILATSNGGATWTAQDASSAGSDAQLASVAFTDAVHGWAVGQAYAGGVILATGDGGATWRAQDARSVGSGDVLSSVTFADAAHGWVVGHGSASSPIILAANIPAAVAASSKGGSGTWLVVAVAVGVVLIVALGVAAAIHRRKTAGGAAAAGSPVPDAHVPIADTNQPGAAQASGEKARFCTGCGSAVAAGSAFCAACGAKVIH